MADCVTNDNCEDVLYPEPLVPAPLPMPSEGGGHEFVSELPAVGTPGVEYVVMDDPTDCSTFKGSFVYNPQCDGWVATSGGGGGGTASDIYTFEKTTTGWVAKRNGKVIFTYNDERILDLIDDLSDLEDRVSTNETNIATNTTNIANNRTDINNNTTNINQNKTDITNIKNDIYGDYLVNRIAVCEDSPLNITVDDTNPDAKVIRLCIDTDALGDKSDGAYEIKGTLSDFLSSTLLGTTYVNTVNVPDLNPDDIVIGETYLYDHNGTMGKVTDYDPNTGVMTVQTMTTSPGSRPGVYLGSVDTPDQLPEDCDEVDALHWTTPAVGDYANVRDDNGKLAQYVIQSMQDCDITWVFDHYINAGDYVVDVLTSDGVLIPKNPDGTVTLPVNDRIKYIKLSDGTTLPVAADYSVTLPDFIKGAVLADGTVLPVNAAKQIVLPDFGTLKGVMVHEPNGYADLIIDTNGKVSLPRYLRGVKDADGNLLPLDVDDTVQLPAIPDPVDSFNDYKIKINTKDWADVYQDIDSIKDMPADIIVNITKDGNVITMASFLAEVKPERDIIFVIGYNNGYIPPEGQEEEGTQGDPSITQEAICLFVSGTEDNLKLRPVAIPRGGGSGSGDKQVPEYTRDLHVGDEIGYLELITHDNILYRAKQNVTLTGNWTIDQQYFELVNTVYKDVFYTHTAVGDKLGYANGRLGADWQMAVALVPFVAKPGNTIANPTPGLFTIPADATVVIHVDLGLYITGSATASSPNGEWHVFVEGEQNNLNNSLLAVDPYGGTNTNHQWALNGSGTSVYTNTTGAPVNIGLYCTSVQQAGKIYAFTSDMVIHEIGKNIDPVEYMTNMGDNDQDVPVGTVISYMGESAPAHYLLCDGAEYALGTYPQLEAWLVDEYGDVNKFGGQPGVTWKVPDMRGEFIRGAGANSHTSALPSGVKEGDGANVGGHQGATTISVINGSSGATIFSERSVGDYRSQNCDRNNSGSGNTQYAWNTSIAHPGSLTIGGASPMTVRPTNTSVNFCIKFEATHRLIINQAGSQADTSTAEAMMKPHTWPVGVEQSFGDGLYGIRQIFPSITVSGGTNPGQDAVLIPGNLMAQNIVNWGGSFTHPNGNRWGLPCSYTAGFCEIYRMGTTPSNPYMLQFSGTTPASGQCKNVDVWVLYTK